MRILMLVAFNMLAEHWMQEKVLQENKKAKTKR